MSGNRQEKKNHILIMLKEHPHQSSMIFQRLLAAALLIAVLAAFGWLTEPIVLLAFGTWLIWPWRKDEVLHRFWISLLVLIGLAFAKALGSVLGTMIAAALIAWLLEPLVGRISRGGDRRLAGALLGVGGGILLMGLLLILVLPVLLKEAGDLLAALPKIRAASEAWISNKLPAHLAVFGLDSGEMIAWLKERAPGLLRQGLHMLGSGGQLLGTGLSGLAGSLMNLVLVPVFALGFSLIGPAARQEVEIWIPLERKTMLRNFGGEVDRIFSGYLRGQLLVSLIVGLLTTLGLWAAGMPWPLLLGMATGVLNIVPLIGVGSMFVICMIVAAFQPEWSWMLLKVTAIFAVVQSLESFLITPRVLGKSVGLHPVLALLALIVFGSLLGPFGLILAVPLGAVLVYIYKQIREQRKQQ
jgi:predicted PurR-regulated permease PerM